MRTTAKLGIAFWDYLGDRLACQTNRHSISARPHSLSRTARLNTALPRVLPLLRCGVLSY